MPELIPAIEPDVPGRDGRSGLLLRAPYREGLVAELKRALPRPHRYWDEGVGAWWIDAREEEHAERIVLRHSPALVLLGGLSMEMAVGTSLVVIAMKSFAGLAGHLGHVDIDWPVTLAVTGAGGFLAPRAERIPRRASETVIPCVPRVEQRSTRARVRLEHWLNVVQPVAHGEW